MKKYLILFLVLVVACNGNNKIIENEILSTPTSVPATAFEIPPTETPFPTATKEPKATRNPDLLSDGEFLEFPEANSLRIMNYNINWDSIFPDDDKQNMSYRDINREEEFSRLVLAIQPDIICLQEVNARRDPQQVSDMLTEITGNPNWVAVNERDSLIATRFSFIEGYSFDFGQYPPELPQAIAMVDIPNDRFGEKDIFATCSHFKAAGNTGDIKLRQRQADILINRIGDAMTEGGVIDLPLNTPILMMGDYNIYDTDPAYHLVTLLTGDIIDEDRYGSDIHPDWDGTDLADVYPSINNQGKKFFTWKDAGSPYNPGALDRIIYTDSVLLVLNSFTLDTTKLTDEALDKYGLEFGDVLFASELGNYDHLPMVVDIELITP